MLYNLLFETFSFNENAKKISNILRTKTHEEILKFCRQNFSEIASGFSRVVYDTGNYFVVKVSIQENNKNQNMREIELKKSCHNDKYFTKIFEYDNVNFYWIIAEKVYPFFSEEEMLPFLLKKLEGIDDEVFFAIKNNKNHLETFQGVLSAVMFDNHDFKINKWLSDFVRVLVACNIDPSDFTAENWGLRTNGDLVVLDYGL